MRVQVTLVFCLLFLLPPVLAAPLSDFILDYQHIDIDGHYVQSQHRRIRHAAELSVSITRLIEMGIFFEMRVALTLSRIADFVQIDLFLFFLLL